MKRAPAVVSLTLLCFLLSYGFVRAGQMGWQLVQSYPGTAGSGAAVASPSRPGDGAPAPALQKSNASNRAPAPAPGAGTRVLLILVDGLSAQDAIRLPTLMHLARSGALYTLQGPEPAWPAPRWATVLTGRSPAAHGVLLATESSPPAGENLLAAVASSGRRVAAVGSETLLRMVSPWAKAGQFPVPATWEGSGAPLLAATDRALATGADLVLIHLEGLHTVAHRLAGTPTPNPSSAPAPPANGAQGSPPATWDEALGWTDARLAQLLSRVNLGRTTVVVVGTFGATPEKGHTDPSLATPLILAGPLASTGRGDGDLRDVAPTVAALFGLPLSGEGQPLTGALRLASTGAQPAGPGTAPPAAVEPAPASGAGEAAGPGWESSPARWVTAGLAAFRQGWHQYWAAARSNARGLVAPALLALGYFLLALRQPPGRTLATAALLHLVIACGILIVLGFRFRPDVPALETPGRAVLQSIGIAAAAGMAPAALLVGLWSGHRGREPAHGALLGLHLTLVVQSLILLGTVPLLLYTGWIPPIRWPGYGHAIRFFVGVAHGAIVGAASPLWALIAAGAAALAAPDRPPREAARELQAVGGNRRPTRPRTSGTTGRTTGSGQWSRTGGRRR